MGKRDRTYCISRRTCYNGVCSTSPHACHSTTGILNMDDISTAVITSISHGHTETLLHLGLKPDGVPDSDARVLYDAAVELLRDKKKINRLALMVRVSGKLQDIKSVDDIFSLNGTGDVPPEDVVKRVRSESTRLNSS